MLYYPPLFRVAAEPGTFRTEAYEIPSSAALASPGGIGGGVFATGAASSNAPLSSAKQFAPLPSDDKDEKRDATQALLDTFRAKSLGGRVTGILPVNVNFPAFGPSVFLVSELTTENQAPAAEFNFQRDKKAGAR